MKKCPFCAEEIQDEAIKCRFCNSFLSAAPGSGGSGAAAQAPATPQAPAAPLAPAVSTPASTSQGNPGTHDNRPPFARGDSASPAADDSPRLRKVLYGGYPSWKAFFADYFFVAVAALVVPFVTNWIASKFDASTFTRLLAILIPLAICAVVFFAITLYRKSKVIRVTNTSIESERGIFSKKIDVLELWRCRDIRYRQGFIDRILSIAHIDVFTADVTTPQLELVGLPASRELFEKIRDAIEIQRQARNVYGVIQ